MFGLQSEHYADGLHALSHLYIDKGQLKEAEKLLIECLAIKK